jgi:hypothetical protein
MKNVQVLMVALALLVFAAVPAFASCVQGNCPIGPCVCFIETGDTSFSDTTCSLWQFTNGASRGLASGDYFGKLDSGNETVSQEVYGGSNGSQIELFVDIDVITDGSPGTERLFIEVRSTGGTLLETLDIVDATESTGFRDYMTSGFAGADVILTFRRSPGVTDGGTEFRVDNADFWRCGG